MEIPILIEAERRWGVHEYTRVAAAGSHTLRWPALQLALVAGAQLGIFFATPLGSLDLSYGYATRGTGRFDISIGQRFQ